MLRRVRAGVAALALAHGLFAAPYMHAHHAIDSVSDEHHRHGQTLVHTHATPHQHHDADDSLPAASGSRAGDERVWSVDGFLFQRPTLTHPPTPAFLAFGEPSVEPATGVRLSAPRPQPKAHGPPLALSSPLRASPVLLPAFV